MTSDTLDDGDTAWLQDLLALIKGGDSTAQDTKTRLPKAPVHRMSVVPTGRKCEILRLRDEAQRLTDHLMRLRQREVYGPARERALWERRRRELAEAECSALREAVSRQKLFLRGLRSVVSTTQRFSMGLDLCHFLHRRTRLARDHTERWVHFDATSLDKRMESAVDVLCRETQALSFQDDEISTTKPFVQCEPLNDGSRSTTYTTMYPLETTDLAAVVRAACVAIRDVVTICPTGHPLRVVRDVVDTDIPSDANVLYRAMRVHHECAATGEVIEVASRLVTSYKITNDYGVVLWDFVDDDERHPVNDALNVTRETTGACLVRRERCADGVERVVFRSLGTKKFRFHNHKSAKKHGRISCINAQADAMVRGDELLFRRLVLDQIATEQAMEVQIAHV